MTQKTYNSYPTFQDVEEPIKRIWNISQVLQAVNEDLGEEEAANYAGQFDQATKTQMYIMLSAIVQRGRESVLKEVMSYA